ncbi:MAG: hypothetical protein WC280_00355 [Patescibacteria group bacterium]
MFDYLDKFNDLSEEIKNAIDNDQSVKIIEDLERKYKVDLASIIMKVVTKDIKIESLPLVFFTELKLGQDKAESLSEELKSLLFYKIANYLDFEHKEKEEIVNDDFAKDVKEGIKVEKEEELIPKLNLGREQAEEVLETLKLSFRDRNEQFLDLLTKHFKGLKSKVELREVLKKGVGVGGFSLADKMVDNVFMIVDSIKKEELEKAKKEAKVTQDMIDKIDRLSHGISSEMPKHQTLPMPDSSHLLPDPEPKPEPKPEPEPEPEPVKKKEEFNDSALLRKEPKIVKKIQDLDSNTGKIKMSDVKKMRVMGPVDEIRYLDLVNFRRMSKNPREALEKIRAKIKLLESLDYVKMLEGIRAWRQSPVNKLYLKMFLKAGNTAMGIDYVISELRNSGKDCLNKDELEAIVEFNRSLRF